MSTGAARRHVTQALRAARALAHALRTGLALAPLARDPREAVRITGTAIRLRARAARRRPPGRWTTLRLGTHGRDFTMVVADYGDLGAIREVLVAEDYEIGAASPRTILDLGAHIGAAAIFFKLRYPDAVVHAVEPNPDTFARLTANIAQFPGITATHAAVADRTGTRALDLGGGSLASSLLPTRAGARSVEVETFTLDDLVDKLGWAHIDLLKLDVEGAEADVLAASQALQKVDVVVGELHDATARRSAFYGLLAGFSVTRRRCREDAETFVARRRR